MAGVAIGESSGPGYMVIFERESTLGTCWFELVVWFWVLFLGLLGEVGGEVF